MGSLYWLRLSSSRVTSATGGAALSAAHLVPELRLDMEGKGLRRPLVDGQPVILLIGVDGGPGPGAQYAVYGARIVAHSLKTRLGAGHQLPVPRRLRACRRLVRGCGAVATAGTR